ncbi:hypothetical protein [Aquibacillus rhizosphaerae]|uniref:Uncharacterized protein n=1 Tax=Aquibacillus rhizosphaerae TaxID=3051431 RepID=A0ABT7L358_9BACI|nr:hypothetical protein [Aquibacillus sp. LR5S19]MDL4839647.1 hypothetical protein [Aquibacillus sp. LR5S19]
MQSDERKIMTPTKESVDINYISIPVTKSMVDLVLRLKKPKQLEELSTSFHDGYLELSGIAIKNRLKIKFNIKLKPINTKNRKVFFEILEFKPMNFDWLNKMIFNIPPIITYEEMIIIDLNEIRKIKSIPYGTINKLEIKDNLIWCQVSL